MTRHIGIIAASLVALALFAGCNSSQSYAPTMGAGAPNDARLNDLPSTPLSSDASLPMLRQIPDAKSYCRPNKVKLPAAITVLAVAGDVKKGGFASSANHKDSLWVRLEIESTTSPTPTPAPTSNPFRPYYLYYGTFSLKNGNSGCALLITSQDGKPLVKTSSFNAVLAGAPAILADYTIASELGGGFAKIRTGKLTAKGGSGTVELQGESSPGVYTRGTIKFTGRAALK
jgi:hypothetical protein